MLPKPFSIIGHRGAAGHAPENSIEAFEIAFAANVDAIEFDVKYVNDQLWVFHDDTVDRLTNGSGDIHAMTREEITHLRLGNGEPIPTLEDVWDIIPPSITINIELKGPNTAEPVFEFMKQHSHRWLVSSFLFDELEILRKLDPNLPIAVLTRTQIDDQLLEVAKSLAAVNVHMMDHVADAESIKKVINSGYKVYVFTVNEIDRTLELRDMGVCGVFTDMPRKFKLPVSGFR